MPPTTSEHVIEKSVTVEAPPEHAFRVFTEEIGAWWPLRTHAVDTDDAETVVFEPYVGGRLYERVRGGEEHDWGTVVAWEPPERLGYTWHPGRGAETAQEVEVTFTAEGRSTRVDVRHWGWEKLGDGLDETIASYDDGWGLVLGKYAEHAGA